MTDEARDKLDMASSRLLIGYPFWGSLVLGLDIVEAPQIDTLATDGVHLFYSPDYVMKQDMEILITDVAHEGGGHKAFLDHLRRGDRDPKIWNYATDYRINIYLKDSGLKLGHDYLYSEKFRDMDAEEIYDYLVANPNSPEMQQAQQKGKGCGCGGLRDHPGTPQNGQGKPKPGPGTSAPPPQIGEADALLEIAQARQFAKKQGMLPGGIDLYVESIVNPKIRWQDVLQQFMEQCSANDYTWLKPTRHMLAYNCYLPSMEDEGVDTFVIVVDTSGSTYEYMKQFLAEVSEIARVLNFQRLIVIYHTTTVYRIDEYDPSDLPIKLPQNLKTGGTNFIPVFEELEQRHIEPNGMVFLTDTYGDFPPAPSYPVLWAVPEKETRAKVEFGDIVWIS